MFGSAVFSLSGLSVANAGSGALLSWGLAGLIAIGFGLVTNQLFRQYPESGGMYHYPEQTFSSPLLGGISTLFYWFGCMAGISFSILNIGNYLASVIELDQVSTTLINLAALALVLLLVIGRLQIMALVNAGLTIALVVGIIMLCIYLRSTTSLSTHTGIIANWQGWGPAISSVPTAFLGFGAIVTPAFLSSSLNISGPKSAQRISTVAKIVLISGSITTLVYVFIVSTFTAAPIDQVFGSDSTTVYAPFQGLVDYFGLAPALSLGAAVLAVIALFTTALVLLRLATQALVSAAEAHSLPPALSRLPMAASFSAAVTVLVIIFYPQISPIVNSGALLTVAFNAIICLSATFSVSGYRKLLPSLVLCALLLTYVPSIMQGDGLIWAVLGGFTVLAAGAVVISRRKYAHLPD